MKPSTTKVKRKERDDEERREVKVGDRIKTKINAVVSHEGRVSSLKRGKGGVVTKVGVHYDDGNDFEHEWPDEDIDIIGNVIIGKSGKSETKGNKRKKTGEGESAKSKKEERK